MKQAFGRGSREYSLAATRCVMFNDFYRRAFGWLPAAAGAWQPSTEWLRWRRSEFREDWWVDYERDVMVRGPQQPLPPAAISRRGNIRYRALPGLLRQQRRSERAAAKALHRRRKQLVKDMRSGKVPAYA